jgi:hypothetical protein
MRFAYWSREVAGWLLVLGGLYAFLQAYGLLLNKRLFEAAPLTFIGFIIFRGGLHVMKVAVAAQAARSLPETSHVPGRRVTRIPTRPVGPTPASAVVPGRRAGLAPASNDNRA